MGTPKHWERWARYADEYYRLTSSQRSFAEEQLPAPDAGMGPTITIMAEKLIRFRANYAHAIALLSEVVGFDVGGEDGTPLRVMLALRDRERVLEDARELVAAFVVTDDEAAVYPEHAGEMIEKRNKTLEALDRMLGR